MTEAEPVDNEPWPLRALILLGLGGLLGLSIHFLTRGPEIWQWTENPARLGSAAGLAAAGIVFGFSLERVRWPWAAAFAAGAGLVVGFVTYWNGQPDSWGAGEGWQLVSALLAVAIAVPLFQASRDAGRWNPDYRTIHAHAWTNVVLWFVAWGFVLIVYLLLHLLSELFQLIGIDLLSELLRKEWFGWVLAGAALGAGVGLLRDRDRVLRLLQRVATAVLAVLAPILALGLVLFVLALPFTGLEPLWEQTRATTPILLSCVIGAAILVNATIGSAADEESPARPVRWGAAALAAVVLPLALVAAVSTGKRVAQHGFTPDRLWAIVFVAITVIGSAAYLYAVVRGRSRWPEQVRALNLRLAILICLVALFLALPIISFGAISTRDQLARLQSGRVPPEKFDWAALRFDFGRPGLRAVERLSQSPNPAVREHALAALKSKNRWDARQDLETYAEAPKTVTVRPVPVPLAPDLREALLGRPGRPGACRGEGTCVLFWTPGESAAVLLMDRCLDPQPADPDAGRPRFCRIDHAILERGPTGWSWGDETSSPSPVSAERDEKEREARLARQRQAIARGEVEIREVARRQMFIGGEPVGEPFE